MAAYTSSDNNQQHILHLHRSMTSCSSASGTVNQKKQKKKQGAFPQRDTARRPQESLAARESLPLEKVTSPIDKPPRGSLKCSRMKIDKVVRRRELSFADTRPTSANWSWEVTRGYDVGAAHAFFQTTKKDDLHTPYNPCAFSNRFFLTFRSSFF